MRQGVLRSIERKTSTSVAIPWSAAQCRRRTARRCRSSSDGGTWAGPRDDAWLCPLPDVGANRGRARAAGGRSRPAAHRRSATRARRAGATLDGTAAGSGSRPAKRGQRASPAARAAEKSWQLFNAAAPASMGKRDLGPGLAAPPAVGNRGRGRGVRGNLAARHAGDERQRLREAERRAPSARSAPPARRRAACGLGDGTQPWRSADPVDLLRRSAACPGAPRSPARSTRTGERSAASWRAASRPGRAWIAPKQARAPWS